MRAGRTHSSHATMDNKARLAAMQQQRAKALARQQAAAQRAQPAALAVAAAGAPVVPPVPIAQARAVAAQPPPSMTRGGQSDAPSMNRGGGQSDQRRRSGEGLPATGSAPSGYAQQASGSQQIVALEAAKRRAAERDRGRLPPARRAAGATPATARAPSCHIWVILLYSIWVW